MTIVVGYDGSDFSMQALDWAMDEAELRGEPILVSHAWHWPYGEGDAFAHDSLRLAAEHVLWHGAECARNCTNGPIVETDLYEGFAAEHLIELSRSAGLVVLGSRGLNGLARTMIGSVADEVVTRAACPVIVVKGAGSLPHRPDPGPIVVGVTGDDDHVLGFAYREAEMRGLPLVVVHAWQYPAGAWGPGTSMIQPAPLAEEVVSQFTEPWQDKYPLVRTVHTLTQGPVVESLLNASTGATMLVVGATRTPGLLGRIGSVTRPVLHRALCPVAVVRASR